MLLERTIKLSVCVSTHKVKKKGVESGAQTDWWQDTQTDPVRTPQQVFSDQIHWLENKLNTIESIFSV